MNEKVRLSIDLDKNDHKLLKIECAKRGLVSKTKIQDLVVEWIEDLQDSEKRQELEKIRDNDLWVCFEEIRRRMNWDAI